MNFLIYTDIISPRKAYVFQAVFEGILGVDFEFTTDESIFIGCKLPKLNYSTKDLGCGLWIKEYGLLQQSGIYEQDIPFVNFETYKAPFAVKGGSFAFDLFSASFYLLSRYEEYVNHERDQYNRFHGKQSLAYQYGFLKYPVIDEWAYSLLELLLQKYPELKYKKRKFSFLPTLDIDMPFYLRSEGWFRRIMKSVKLLLQLEFKALFRDPFDVYQQVKKWDETYQTQTMYFLLMGNKHKLDNPNHKNKEALKGLIRRLNPDKIGLHPSFQSNLDFSELAAEKQQLEDICRKEIKKSRQHYLVLDIPFTYKNLLAVGIEEDYSMAFADEPGFRAGTCTPFFWYDLSEEKITTLRIFPTAVMDQTLKKYQQLDLEKAKTVLKMLVDRTKRVDGQFITLWHNESVGDFGPWKDWQNVYIEMLEIASV